jgi:hypothetical protein
MPFLPIFGHLGSAQPETLPEALIYYCYPFEGAWRAAPDDHGHRQHGNLINNWLWARLTKLRDDVSLSYMVRSAGEVRPFCLPEALIYYCYPFEGAWRAAPDDHGHRQHGKSQASTIGCGRG